MTIKLRGGIGVENVSAGEKVLIPFVWFMQKNTERQTIFQYKYSVSITYLYNIYIF